MCCQVPNSEGLDIVEQTQDGVFREEPTIKSNTQDNPVIVKRSIPANLFQVFESPWSYK